MIELWRRLTILHMTHCERWAQQYTMQTWSAWQQFKHSLYVTDTAPKDSADV